MPTRPTGSLQGRRILVVEDEYFIADDIARSLARAGAVVIGPVASVAAAMAKLDKHGDIDGAVLDINLKGERIYPVAEALEARGISFLFATGYDAAALPPRFRNVPLWQKPFESTKLIEAMTGTGALSGK